MEEVFKNQAANTRRVLVGFELAASNRSEHFGRAANVLHDEFLDFAVSFP